MEDDGHVKDLEMHLTNVAVQRHSGKFDKTVGGKWPLSRMKPFFLSRFGTARTRAALAQIERAVVGSLLSVQKTLINDKHCFELYGYDFLLDDEFRPWLLEVNGSPSLTANTPSDYSLKFKMLMDVLDVVDLEQSRSDPHQKKVGGFDLIYHGACPELTPFVADYRSFLGCVHDWPSFSASPSPGYGGVAGASAAFQTGAAVRGEDCPQKLREQSQTDGSTRAYGMTRTAASRPAVISGANGPKNNNLSHIQAAARKAPWA
eukprot:GHVT01061923.1.p1 GENE.GHVT01061923.1~~GHVT01061923.1.p1  ORF type:complete len:261 (-),score=38.73 GHVT01061923.1:667-1449(-)